MGSNSSQSEDLLRMDFDASSCYDRIIPNIASLAARSYGQHQTFCFLHVSIFRQAQYKLKTKLSLSDEDNSHCLLHPIYGTGQGSTNSPVIWVPISSRLFDAHTTRAHGTNFVSPDGFYHLTGNKPSAKLRIRRGCSDVLVGFHVLFIFWRADWANH
jgi:hypothetical protein